MNTKTTRRKTASGKSAPASRKWSVKVTQTSDAMDLQPGVFKSDDPARIARSVKRSALKSHRRKASPYRSAVAMISFYENRGGNNLSPRKKQTLQRAKTELKREFGK